MYAKALVAVLMTIVSAIIAALSGDAHIDMIEWINIAIAGTTALSVFTAPNVPGAHLTKSVLAAIMAVLALAVNLVIVGGVPSTTQWLQMLVAGLGAVGVYAARNGGVSGAPV